MRASLIIAMVAFLGLTVSCAHKNQTEGIDQQAKAEAGLEKKAEKKEEQKQADMQAFTCLVGKDKRLVTLDKKEKRCEVNYTKYGDQQQVAWAEATPSICDQAYDSIRSNIEQSGFQCNDGTELKIEEKKEEKKAPETAKTELKKDEKVAETAKAEPKKEEVEKK